MCGHGAGSVAEKWTRLHGWEHLMPRISQTLKNENGNTMAKKRMTEKKK